MHQDRAPFRRRLQALGAALVATMVACHDRAPTSPSALTPAGPTAGDLRLVWQDEFDGSSLGPSWTTETGGHGWGNNELQFYRAENVRVAGGSLVIEARREAYGGREFTSARLKTQGRAEWRYGRFEIRARVPPGRGLWPAFWMLGSNFDAVGWPSSGEIDVFEHIGREPARVYGTLHGPGYSGAGGVGGWYDVPGGRLADAFHLFAVEWDEAGIRWSVDGTEYKAVTPSQVPGPWVFDQPFFLILNLAVGGDWPGPPDTSTTFPATLAVDYVRVYTRNP